MRVVVARGDGAVVRQRIVAVTSRKTMRVAATRRDGAAVRQDVIAAEEGIKARRDGTARRDGAAVRQRIVAAISRKAIREVAARPDSAFGRNGDAIVSVKSIAPVCLKNIGIYDEVICESLRPAQQRKQAAAMDQWEKMSNSEFYLTNY